MALTEILAVLADEIAEVEEVIKLSIQALLSADDKSTFVEIIEVYKEQLERLLSVAEMLELSGLEKVVQFIQSNLQCINYGDNLTANKMHVFEVWPILIIGYLSVPKEGVYSQEISIHLSNKDWPQPLNDQQSEELNQELLLVTTMVDDDSHSQSKRQTQSQAEDADLAFPDDIHPALLDAFLTEGPVQAIEFSELIQKFETGEGLLADVDQVRRVIHNIKGSANTVGVRGVAVFAHNVEDILDYCIDNAFIPKGYLVDLLVQVADTIEIMYDFILDGNTVATDQSLVVLQSVLDVANQIDQGDFSIEDSSSEQSVTIFPVVKQTNIEKPVATKPDTLDHSTQAPNPVTHEDSKPVKKAIALVPKVRVAVESIDEMLRFSGEMAISRSHIQERLQQSKKMLDSYRERDDMLWDRINQLDELISTQGIESIKQQSIAMGGQQIANALDPLEMDQYSEMHTQVQALMETVADLKMLRRDIADTLGQIDGSLRETTLFNNDLHELIMATRMVPASTLEHRLQRTIRQASNHVGKQVVINFIDNEVKLDDQMINHLVDPLQHLLRNSVIHGIETTEQRRLLDKPDFGTINLSFERDGNYLNVSCQDDGQGLDLMTIYDTAVKKGLTPAGQNISDNEIERLIFQPGFTTTTEVTEMAGRGVGMDVVNANIRKLKGNININNKPGKGLEFVLRLPMTMGIIHCLVVEVQGQVFAVSVNNLNRIVHNGTKNAEFMSNQWYYREPGSTYPLYELSELVGLRKKTDKIDPTQGRPVILVNNVDGHIAVAVDSVRVARDLVIKTLGAFVGNIDGVLGASILGNGQVIYILEMLDLIDIHTNQSKSSYEPTDSDTETDLLANEPSKINILVVDDSLSTRTSLSIMLQDNNFSPITANDGLDAIESIKLQKPSLILLDLEMPRMDGLELTAHIRLHSDIKDIPIFMITSRTGEKHRNLANKAGVDEYITKPYTEDQLLRMIDAKLGVIS